MKDQIVSFETAKLAKEKGFDGLCFDAYNTYKMKYSDGWLEYIDDNEIEIPFTSKVLKSEDILSPTQSLLQKWLREVHNLIVIIDWGPHLSKKYSYEIYQKYSYEIYHNGRVRAGDYVNATYEDALEKCLVEALKLI